MVDELVSSADPTVAEVFFLPTIVSEFPINWCIRSDAFEVSPAFIISYLAPVCISELCSEYPFIKNFNGILS